MDIKKFEKLPLMGIMRGVDISLINPLMEVIKSSGLSAIEITMNTPGAEEVIQETVRQADGEIAVGAGTVLSQEELKKALSAGASFIVSPACIEEVVEPCVEEGIPVFPGAFTPQEVLNAWKAGASMVKVFPASMFGAEYFKVLKGPFDGIKLMAVGGVRLESIGKYFSYGADAVAFGSGIFKKEWIEKKDFASIGDLIKDYVQEVRTSLVK